jgi:SAM-dependent methyltransferase
MTQQPWYVSLFGEEYFHAYGPLLTDERTAREVDGIIQLLGLDPGSAILDLACGHGRHAIPLAQHGYQVTGLDLSDVFLGRAKAEANARDVHVRWTRADMRDIPFEGEFDAVINIFTAFGYFDSDTENAQVLRQVHKALRPDGRFLIETMHRDSLVRAFEPSSVTRHEDGLLVTEERKLDQVSGRCAVRLTLIYPDGRRTELGHDVRVYTPTELAALISQAGFTLQAAYGGLDGSPLTLTSRRLVMVAEKPA